MLCSSSQLKMDKVYLWQTLRSKLCHVVINSHRVCSSIFNGALQWVFFNGIVFWTCVFLSFVHFFFCGRLAILVQCFNRVWLILIEASVSKTDQNITEASRVRLGTQFSYIGIVLQFWQYSQVTSLVSSSFSSILLHFKTCCSFDRLFM